MTKKQIIATSVIAVILIGLMIVVSVYGKSKNTIDDSQSNVCSESERRQLAVIYITLYILRLSIFISSFYCL
jgi:hypothetical protein